MGPWISVKKQMPETDKYVLVKEKWFSKNENTYLNYYSICVFDGEDWMVDTPQGLRMAADYDVKPFYWMPIPE